MMDSCRRICVTVTTTCRNAEVIQPQGHATELFPVGLQNICTTRAENLMSHSFCISLITRRTSPSSHRTSGWPSSSSERYDLRRSVQAVAFIEHLDDGIGRVLTALKQNGLDQNTLIVFTADNGGSLPHAQNNDPWRDGKQSHYDGGLRVPFMVRWPEHIAPGSRCDYAGLNFDLFPTFLQLAGTKPGSDLDAMSLVPLFSGNHDRHTARLYFVRREGGSAYGGKSYEAIIRGDWKLMQNNPYSPLELYNLVDDPHEQRNQATTNKRIFNELSALRDHIQRRPPRGKSRSNYPMVRPTASESQRGSGVLLKSHGNS